MTKRIVWAIDMPTQWKTGGQKYYVEVARYLQKEGWNLVFYVPPRGTSRSRVWRNLVCNCQIARVLLSITREGGIVVEDAEWHSRFLLANILLRLHRPVRIVTVSHHVPPRDLIARRDLWGVLLRKLDWLVTGAFFRTVDRIVTVSESTKRDVMGTGIPGTRVAIVPDGLERSPRINVSRDGSEPRALFVGHCSPIKGVEYLLEAMRLLKDSVVILDLVGDLEGDIKYSSRMQEMAREWGMSDRVIFHGRVPEGRLRELYARADMFVLPSLWEGFGIVLLEAMAFGLPVVATRIGAIPELVHDGENGLLVPSGDGDALAGAVARLIADPSLRERLGRTGRARCEASLTWEQVGEKFETVLAQVMAELSSCRRDSANEPSLRLQ